jgi:MSHA biogenesis protein MshO
MRPDKFENRHNHSNSGFTLLEFIIVIVIVAIMAISLSKLTNSTVYSYIDAKDRNRLSQSAKWITERISREVREALPQSVRANVSGSFHCVEFMAIVNASTYLDIPASGSLSSFNAVGYNLVADPANFVAIMPIDPASLYASSGVLAGVNSIVTSGIDPNQAVVTLNAATNFTRRSPQRRFYLLDTPVSFCLDDTNGNMTRHDGYAIAAAQQFPPPGGSVIGENFSANTTVFNYQLGTLSRSGLLQINLFSQNRGRNLTGNSESFDVFHEVHVRNVP